MNRNRKILSDWARTRRPFDHLIWVGIGISIADIKGAVVDVLDRLDGFTKGSTL